MKHSVVFAAVLLAALSCGAEAKPRQDTGPPLPKNEIEARVPSNYLALPRIHLPVEVDENRRYRALDLEVWLLPKDEDNLAIARSSKKAIMQALKSDLASFRWEAFEDAKEGPEVAKKFVMESVERSCGAKINDVMIKSMVLK